MIEQVDALTKSSPSQSMIWALATLSENQRRILELLNGVWPRGYPEALPLAKGFDIELLSSLVRDGLATVATETVRAGGRTLGIANVRITDAGRRAIEG
jgi:hypothetical protein